jgi:2-polyprenyl-3-methyl-5-hydroxy-6-metoxy-1,4-benzoquinol methylase
MSADRERAAVLAREIEFHDALARELDPTALPAKPLDPFDPVVLENLGDVAGKDVLDVGCGDGTLALVLAKRGARVAAFDLSPGMIEVARERARLHLGDNAQDVEFQAAAFEEVQYPPGSFDLIVGKFILHHVDLEVAATRVKRWLRPGGHAYFLETSALNPLLALARRLLPGRAGVERYGTADEHPLTRRQIRYLVGEFDAGEISHPVMWFVRMVNRHIFKWRFRRITKLTNRVDDWLARFRFLGPLSYYVAIRVRAAPES